MRVSRLRFLIVLVTLVLFLGIGELVARFGLGLGTPPLSKSDPLIEYLYLPNQDVKRFGNRFLTNTYSMRSENFPKKKLGVEFRVMVFGDSVLNGGNLTDHDNLATTLLAKRLTEAKRIPVVVGNISAGSWGPGNWLAYARKFGFFEADIVLLLISSHDIGDNPTFAPLNPNTLPQVRPMSALWEGVQRYLPRYLPDFATSPKMTSVTDPMAPVVSLTDEQIEQGRADLKEFLSLARSQVPRVLVAQFPEQAELGPSGPYPGYGLINSIADETGVKIFSIFPIMKAALDRGKNPYRDNIHVNDDGQSLLADLFFDAVMNGDAVSSANAR